ncbi:MAG TPA: glycosyltransferase [Caulobacterales bacterium]|nr:glycosyltransferase [Caulobacterales bacterium]
MSAAPTPRRAYLLANTPISDDPRVRRVGDLLNANGWAVVGIGLSGGRSSPPAWPLRTVQWPPAPSPAPSPPAQPPPSPAWRKALRESFIGSVLMHTYIGSIKNMRAAKRDALRRFGTPEAVERYIFWQRYPHLLQMRDIACAQTQPGVWIANDWNMLPIAAAAAAHVGGCYVYDSHEFAIEEYAQDRVWRRTLRPIAAAVERNRICGARLVTSVSPDITEALRRIYSVSAPTETIRNVPALECHAFRATGAHIRILYHGALAPGRGLEQAIDAMNMIRPEFDLTIRGGSTFAGYPEQLQARIDQLGLAPRIRLEAPIPMTQLVSAAAIFDIGLMALPGHSAHNRFALPNKVFEYMMAGLALCVSDLPSMRSVVEGAGAGVLIPDVSAETISQTINSLTRGAIDGYKQAALRAANTYNWEQEGRRLLRALTRLTTQGAPAGA